MQVRWIEGAPGWTSAADQPSSRTDIPKNLKRHMPLRDYGITSGDPYSAPSGHLRDM
jgi:hypothetical protein